MSKLKRLLGVFSILSLFVFSSCVDDEIAPEVTALRQAQVELLNANTSVQQSIAAMNNASAASTEAATARANAAAAIQNAIAQEDLNRAVAVTVTTLIEQQLAQEIAREELERASIDLANTIATYKIDIAADLLAQWNGIIFGEVFPKLTELNEKSTELEVAKLFLDEDEEVTRAYLQELEVAKLARLENELAALNTELEAIDLILDGQDPAAAADGLLEDLEEQKVTLQNERDAVADQISAINRTEQFYEALIAFVQGEGDADLALVEEMEDEDGNPYFSEVEIEGLRDWYAAVQDTTGTPAAIVAEQKKITDADAAIAARNAEQATWNEYADAVLAVVNQTKEDIGEDILALFADDEEESTGDGTLSAVVSTGIKAQIAFSKLLAAENTLRDKGEDAVLADTTAYVNARLEWDGLRKVDLFDATASTADGDPFREALAVTTNVADGDGVFQQKGGVTFSTDFTDGSATLELGANSTLKAYLDAVTASGAAVATETIAEILLRAEFEDFVEELDSLTKYAAAVKAGNVNRVYGEEEEEEVVVDITTSAIYTQFVSAVEGIGGDFDLKSDPAAIKAAIAAQNAIKTAANNQIKALEKKLADANKVLADNAAFIAPFLAEYTTAVAYFDEDNAEVRDSIALVLLPLQARQFRIDIELANVDFAITEAQNQRTRDIAAATIYVADGEGGVTAVALADRKEALEGPDGEIASKLEEIEEQEVFIATWLLENVELENNIAILEAEIAALEAEIEILNAQAEAIAAAIAEILAD